jgi:cytochrome c biogenesis protein
MGTTARLLRSLWRTLASTQLAAILMALLLLATLLASLLPQMPSDPTAHEPWLSAVAQHYGRTTGFLSTLGLFDAYHTPWYLALLIALLLNTLICTVQRLPRLWTSLTSLPAVVRPEAFYRGFAQRHEWPVVSLEAGLAAAQQALQKHRYRPRIEQDQSSQRTYVYAEKGRWAQAGTLVSHVAALCLVLAVTARPALAWQESGLVLLPGQTHTLDEERPFEVQAGPLQVAFYADGQPSDYQVPLAVVVHGSAVTTQTVRINHPLTYRGISFHLQSYGPGAKVITPEGTFQVAFAKSQIREVALPGIGPRLRLAYQPEGETLFVEAITADGSVLASGAVSDGQQIEVEGMPIHLVLSQYTVWQVSRDPTFIPAVIAAGSLLLGIVVSLWVPHRRLWLYVDDRWAKMVGLGDFNSDFEVLAGEIAYACRPGDDVHG